MRYQMTRLGLDRERGSQLKAGNRPQNEAGQEQHHAEDPQGRPFQGRPLPQQRTNGYAHAEGHSDMFSEHESRLESEVK